MPTISAPRDRYRHFTCRIRGAPQSVRLMTRAKEGSGFGKRIKRLLLAAMVIFVIREAWLAVAPDPEIALIIGEPWEDMRARSSASIGPSIPGHFWYQMPDTDARLRLLDPHYGFVTPKARFFTINFDNDHVGGIRMSPQVEPLLLDDTVKVLMDLQDQWRASGWSVVFADEPAFVDTPEWREALREASNGKTTFWQAADKYQALLVVARFADDRHPDQERYLITLNVSRPWIPPPTPRKKGSARP